MKRKNKQKNGSSNLRKGMQHSYKISNDYFWSHTESLGFMMKLIGIIFSIFFSVIIGIIVYYAISRQLPGLYIPAIAPAVFLFFSLRRWYKYRFFTRNDVIDGHKFLKWHKGEMEKYENEINE